MVQKINKRTYFHHNKGRADANNGYFSKSMVFALFTQVKVIAVYFVVFVLSKTTVELPTLNNELHFKSIIKNVLDCQS